MRALIHFPIIHSPQDLGSFSDASRALRTPEQENHYLTAVNEFWDVVSTTIASFNLDYKTVKLYQDGLPVCGKESEIVAEVANSGSENFKLLQALNQQGATLMGTELADLLVNEHDLMLHTLKAEKSAIKNSTNLNGQDLLDIRDEYIAQRIDQTLFDNEMGILFLGFMHNIETKLPSDILLIQPLGKPAF
ncbi:MAG: hypothetical protein RLZ75_2603 [Pseudomonadota bacterium]|jgi:hypothetical protein